MVFMFLIYKQEDTDLRFDFETVTIPWRLLLKTEDIVTNTSVNIGYRLSILRATNAGKSLKCPDPVNIVNKCFVSVQTILFL